jgi:hypothetical protein
MPKKYKIVEAEMKVASDLTLKDTQRKKSQTDKLANKKASSAIPKNNPSVFSAKPEPNRGLGADRHPNVPRGKLTRPTMESKINEDGGAVSVGSGAVAGITDPTTNYAFQVLKKKQQKMARRKKPVGEEFAAGIGNTQAPANSKKEPTGKSLKSFKNKSTKTGKKVSSAPDTPSGIDGGMPIGGQ